ncbi:MAG: hypothetical protein VSS75_020165 [Candidatus Parabeggiatoa sp.]|nr:hypothetical protein [Candidatus Parabeggiatoa sp.]
MPKMNLANTLVEEIRDKNAEKRSQELFSDVYNVVNGTGTLKHRIKNSIRTFIHTDLTNSMAHTNMLGFSTNLTVGVGIAVAVAAIGATGPIGMLVVATGAIITWAAKKTFEIAKHSKMKQKVIDTIRSGAEFPTKITKENQPIADAMLGSLVYDLGEFVKDYKNCVDSRLTLNNQPIDFTPAKIAAVIHLVSEQEISGVGNAKKRANPGLLRRVFTSEYKPDSFSRLKIRVARILYYFQWLRAYLDTYANEATSHLEQIASNSDNLMERIKNQVHYTGNHVMCPNDFCYGPSGQDITVTQKSAQSLGVSDAFAKHYAEIIGNKAKFDKLMQKKSGPLPQLEEENEDSLDQCLAKSTEILEHDFTGIINEAVTSDPFKTMVGAMTKEDNNFGGYVIDEGLEGVTLGVKTIANLKQGNKNEAIIDGAGHMGKLGVKYGIVNPLENAIKETAGEIVSGGVGKAITICVESAIARTQESFKYNRPILNKVTAVLHLPLDETQAQLDKDVIELLKKGKNEVLMRLLSKVNYHYPIRYTDKATKLKEDLERIQGRINKKQPGFTSCKEAYKVVRHLLKINRYAEKHLLHIALLNSSLDIMDERFKRGQ